MRSIPPINTSHQFGSSQPTPAQEMQTAVSYMQLEIDSGCFSNIFSSPDAAALFASHLAYINRLVKNNPGAFSSNILASISNLNTTFQAYLANPSGSSPSGIQQNVAELLGTVSGGQPSFQYPATLSPVDIAAGDNTILNIMATEVYNEYNSSGGTIPTNDFNELKTFFQKVQADSANLTQSMFDNATDYGYYTGNIAAIQDAISRITPGNPYDAIYFANIMQYSGNNLPLLANAN